MYDYERPERYTLAESQMEWFEAAREFFIENGQGHQILDATACFVFPSLYDQESDLISSAAVQQHFENVLPQVNFHLLTKGGIYEGTPRNREFFIEYDTPSINALNTVFHRGYIIYYSSNPEADENILTHINDWIKHIKTLGYSIEKCGYKNVVPPFFIVEAARYDR